jgi:hypothetical protein
MGFPASPTTCSQATKKRFLDGNYKRLSVFSILPNARWLLVHHRSSFDAAIQSHPFRLNQ